MNKNEFYNEQIKVGGTTDVEPISIKYKDKDYNFKTHPNNKASKTGHVVIAELIPNDEKLPRFIFRWDHGDGIMDVDIFSGGKNHRVLWKQEGYCGHRTKLIDDERREYFVLIKIPERKIFEGVIKVGLLTELNLFDDISISESADIKVCPN